MWTRQSDELRLGAELAKSTAEANLETVPASWRPLADSWRESTTVEDPNAVATSKPAAARLEGRATAEGREGRERCKKVAYLQTFTNCALG